MRGLSLHLARLTRDCKEVFGAELDADRVLRVVRQVAKEQVGAFTARVTVFDPELTMGNIGDPARPQLLVTVRPASHMPPPPLTAKTFTFSRDLPLVKHIGLFGQLRLRRVAQTAGFDDAIFVEPDGRFSEGTTWNLGFVDLDGLVIWPDGPALPGVTMQLLQTAHADSIVRPVTRESLGEMRVAFAVNVSIGVRAIAAIDNTQFAADDSTLDLLRKSYAEIPTGRLFGDAVPLVTQWTGREIKAFRAAIRMSLLEFATAGVSDRIVLKWEAGGTGRIPRMVNQAALDTLLAQAAPDVHGRNSSDC